MSTGSLVFLGAGEVAVPTLHALARAGERIALVLTQPDRPKGRGRKTAPTPVGLAARELGLTTEAVENVNDPAVVQQIKALAPEFLVLVDFGQLLRDPLLGASLLGPVNLHPSLLPRHRGPSPVAGALLAGDARTGVTTMFMDSGMDSGPLLLQEEAEILPGETAGELTARLARQGADLVVKTLRGVRDGTVHPRTQDEGAATFTRLFDRAFCELDWRDDAAALSRRVLALSPRPGARATLGGKMLKILRAVPAPGEAAGTPGCVLSAREDGVDVRCGVGALTLLEVHPEGKRPMASADFARGGGIARGMAFDLPAPSPE